MDKQVHNKAFEMHTFDDYLEAAKNRKEDRLMPSPLSHCDPEFRPFLADFGEEMLESYPGTVFGLWPDLHLAYLNRRWQEFADANEGEPAISTHWGLGANLVRALPHSLRPFFLHHFELCLSEDRPWEHTYECSSPEIYREFQMMVFPVGRCEGLLSVHALRVERPHDREARPAFEDFYRTEHGLIRQCSHCRRVSRQDTPLVWDWVPEWVKQIPEKTTHTICETCLGYYYTDDRVGNKPVTPRKTTPPDAFNQRTK